jgi:hypothetical protein
MNANDRLPEQEAAMRPVPRMRRDRTLFLFLFAVALVSISVVAVAWHYAALNPEAQERRCGGGYDVIVPLAFNLVQSNGNWTLTSTCTNKAIHIGDVTVTIWDVNGAIVNPMRSVLLTNLTEANWATYHVLYVKAGSEDYVRQSAQIVIDMTWYHSGYRCELADYESILYLGVLR